MKIWKQILILLIITIIAYFGGSPVIRFYNEVYPVDVGGLPAFLAGVWLCLDLLFGIVVGLFYKNFYKQALFVLSGLLLSCLAIYNLLTLEKARAADLLLLVAGFFIGFLIRKIYEASRNYMISEVQKSERKY